MGVMQLTGFHGSHNFNRRKPCGVSSCRPELGLHGRWTAFEATNPVICRLSRFPLHSTADHAWAQKPSHLFPRGRAERLLKHIETLFLEQ